MTDTIFSFYGSSTMWGDGNRDKDTIPSVFARENQVSVVNNGEAGYIARQSLAWLINEYILEKEAKRKVVIFYDGTNDVIQRCWRENSGLSTHHEKEHRKRIAGAYNLGILNLRPIKDYIDDLLDDFGKLSKPETALSCAASPERAMEVARTLVETWEQARLLVDAHGGSFIAILQPVAYTGSPNLDRLPNIKRDRLGHGPEHLAVYAEVKSMARNFPDLNFLDFTDACDGDDYFYIDHCHVSPGAHEVLVNSLSEEIRKLGYL